MSIIISIYNHIHNGNDGALLRRPGPAAPSSADQRGELPFPAKLAGQRPCHVVAVALAEPDVAVRSHRRPTAATAAALASASPKVQRLPLREGAHPATAALADPLTVDEGAADARFDLGDEARKGVHEEARAGDEQQVGLRQVAVLGQEEGLGHGFPEEDDVRLHEAAVLRREPAPPLARGEAAPVEEDGLAHLLQVHLGARRDAGRAVEVAVRSHHLARRQARDALEAVDVLRHHPPELALVVQELAEVVRRRGLELAGPQLAAQQVERIGLLLKEADVEHGLGHGQLVLLQVVVEASARRAKVWDARAHARPRAEHHDNVRRRCDCPGHVLDDGIVVAGGRRRRRTAGPDIGSTQHTSFGRQEASREPRKSQQGGGGDGGSHGSYSKHRQPPARLLSLNQVSHRLN